MDVVDAVRDAQGGFVTWAELSRRGVTRAALHVALQRRVVVRVARGLYRPDAGEELLVAARAMNGVVSHEAAAVVWGFPTLRVARHVTVPRNRRDAVRRGVIVHRCDLGSDDVVERAGVRITSPLRTVLDCARTLPLGEAVAVADAALHGGLDRADLVTAAAGLRGPGSARVRTVARLADGRTESLLESLLRVLLVTNGLVPTHLQYVVRDVTGAAVGRVDLCFSAARLLVEADGFTFHRERHDYRLDRRKANSFELLGWRLLRFSWEDVVGDPEYVVGAVRALLDSSLDTHNGARRSGR